MPHISTSLDTSADLGASLREKEALYRVTSAIIEHAELSDLLQTVVDSVAEALPAERVVLITFDLQAQVVLHFVKGGSGADSVMRVPFEELLHGLSGWVLREQCPALSPKAVPDPREMPEVQLRRSQTNCGDIIVVPLLFRGTILGTLTAINQFDGAPFGQRQVDIMLAMASHSAIALTTAEYQDQLLREIQERKKLEHSLAQARDQALDASRMKSEFLANMSHEIRTPMNAILGLLRILQGTELSTRQLDYVNKTQGAAQSLLGLINDILDFSKVEAGKITMEHEPLRLDQVLRNLSVLLSASVGSKDVEVLFDIDPSLPAVVQGDALRLQQVLTNLGGNAVKFTPQGHVLLTLRQMATDASTVAIAFSVQDTGIGIAPEHQARIFSAFSQAESSTTRRYGGTGLGLAISKRFVELMGGDLQVHSVVGEGSRFDFTLKMPIVADVPVPLVPAARPAIPHQRVLVVDDNALAGELTQRMAQSWGWRVSRAHHGQDALDQAATALERTPHEFPYTLIFMDWQMPGMDGWETARHLRKLAESHQLSQPCIIMVTAQGRETLAQRSEAEHASLNGFLVKPVTASMLLDAFLDAQSGDASLRTTAGGRASMRRLQGMRILVVEDNLINQQVAEELLCSEGAIVSLAANGRMGVDAVAVAAPQFDVVLMDVQMPVLDGYGATRAIREELQLMELPIIAMTANAMASDRIACLAAGMNEHIGKPFDMDRLVQLLIRTTGIEPVADNNTHRPASPSHSASDATPDIPGLEITTALARMGGLRALYVRTLRDFSKVLETAWDELQALLATGDTPTALMRLHTLKGNAATLGANTLADITATLERLYRANAPEAELAQGLQQLARVIPATQALLAQAQVALAEPHTQAEPTALSHYDISQVIDALHNLDTLAQASDLDVLQRFTELHHVFASVPGNFSEQLEIALQDLALDTVHHLCQAKLAELRTPPP